jgi:hypothetical protein
MKRIITGSIVLGGLIAGCSSQNIITMSNGVRQDIFKVASCKEPIPSKNTDLIVVSSIKTMKPGNIFWGKTSRGTSEYSLLLNIDGQATRVKGDIVEEKTAVTGIWDPEEGEGIRYLYRIELCLSAGPHKISVALPEDGTSWEGGISLTERTFNVLKMAPVYRRRHVERLPALNAETSFSEGIKGFRAYLNGKEI